MITTIHFYDECSEQYAELTAKADMSKQYAKFMAYLPSGAGILDAGDGDADKVDVANDKISILDAGCGSGRDSLFFMKKGYAVTMLDASAGMCKSAEKLTGRKALCMKFDEIEFADQFDGIWACASLLHVPEKELEAVFVKFWRALKDNGILYASWKYGEEERYDGERFYCDMTEAKLKNVLARVKMAKRLQDANLFSETHGCESDANLFECVDCWVEEDALPLGREQKWLNVVLGKK